MKKRYTVLMTTLILSVFFSIDASAYDVKVDGIYYNLIPNGNVAEVTKGNNKYEGDITIPSSIKVNDTEYSVTIVGNSAFEDCNSLTSITIPNSVTSIGSSAFEDCSSLTSITIPNSVTSIGERTFCNCISLTSVTIPNSVTSIGSSAFEDCSSLTSVTIPNSVTSIGEGAFESCSSMTFVKIGNGINTIPKYSFSGCSSLPTIQIPQNVTNIGDYVFYRCESLETVLMDDGETELTLGSSGSSPLFASCPLDSVYIGRNINYSIASDKGYSPFYRNTKLRSVTITDKETEISPNEFYGCTALKNVRIGDGVTTFGNWAFSGCSSLDFFAFGSSVETIGKEAFSDCSALTKLISRAAIPPVCGTQALDDINKWECTLLVPDGSLTLYQTADQWKEFFFTEIVPNGIKGVEAEPSPTSEAEHFDLQGRRIDKAQKGINIIRNADGTTKKVLIKR